jgi:NitT/TauT family transport system substrate-binding protein
VAWEIAQQKGFFAKHKVNVKLVWFEYGPQMEAFSAGRIDAAGLANGDAVMLNATGKRNIMVLINDYSNGNDKIVAVRGIPSIKDLKGKKIGVEVGCLSHLLLLNALKKNGLSEKDVELVNMPTHQAAQTLASGQVSAIVAWQPNSGAALELVKGSKSLYTSEDEPGIIYDTLAVSAESYARHRAEWAKVVAAWYDVIDYLNDPANKNEALKILSARVGVPMEKYAGFYSGTRFLSAKEALEKFNKAKGYGSIYGSSELANQFFVDNKIYEKPVDVSRVIDPGLTRNFVGGREK